MAETIKNNNVFVVDASTGAQKFLDFHGLDLFWDRAKKYVDDADKALGGRIDTVAGNLADLQAVVNGLTGESTQGASIADRINAAIAALKLDETYEKVGVAETKANAAQAAAIESANSYTNGQISTMATTLRGEMANDLAEANKYTDDEIVEAVGSYTVEGESPVVASGLRKEIEDRDAQVLAGARTYADGLNEAMDTRMKVVESGVEGVDDKITAAFNDFATKVSNDNLVNTYKELIDYAAAHGSEFTELVGVVSGKADTTYVDQQDSALDVRIKALDDHKNDYVAADATLASTLRGEIATAKSGAETTAAAYTDQKVGALAGTVETLAETVASNHTAAMQEAADKAAAAKSEAIADTVEKLKSYSTTAQMEEAIRLAKEAAIADAKSKVDALTETVTSNHSTAMQEAATKANAAYAAAIAYSSEYTDQLFRSVQFVTDVDINGLFA